MKNEIIQKYVNNFRRLISNYLKPNIGLQIDIYNCGNEGAIIVLYFKPGGKSFDDDRGTYGSISEALQNIEQPFFKGELTGFRFKGTNIGMSPDKIILIKDSSENEWSNLKLKEDLNTVLKPPKKKERGQA